MREVDTKDKDRVYIWSLPTRLFHWMFAVSVAVAYFLAETKHWLEIKINHQPVAYVAFSLLLFRLLWGFWGPKYSLFKDFKFSKKDAKSFICNFFKKDKVYMGHNFLASFNLMGILVVSFIAIIFGFLSFGIEKGKGVLSFMYSSTFKSIGLFGSIHVFLINVLLCLVVIHILGVLSDKIIHREYSKIGSIFNGYIVVNDDSNHDGIKLNFYQRVFAILSFIAIFYFIAHLFL